MSWDPNQQPPSGQNPYSQQPSGQPYNPQQSVPNPYEQASGQPGYSMPLSGQPGYGAPPSGYGAPGFQQPVAMGYAPVAAPQSWGQALQALPGQYIKILTKPGAASFAEEQVKATWGMIWTQLIIIGLIGTIFGLISAAIGAAVVSSVLGGSAGAVYGTVGALFAGSDSVYAIVSVIISFFIIVGIQYLLAKGFGGNGTFVQQGYDYLLVTTPIAVVSYVLNLIPVLGGIASFALLIYGLVLNVFGIMASHRLSGGKATWVVLIPILALILLGILCVVALATIFASLLGGLIHGAAGQ